MALSIGQIAPAFELINANSTVGEQTMNFEQSAGQKGTIIWAERHDHRLRVQPLPLRHCEHRANGIDGLMVQPSRHWFCWH